MLSDKTILVLGDVMLDQWVHTKFQGISQETDVSINKVVTSYFELGGAGNAARICKYLTGARILLIGVVGNDPNGGTLNGFLETEGLEGIFFIDSKRQTTSKTRIYIDTKPLVRVDDETDKEISEDLEKEIIRKVKDLSSQLDGILLSDYGKGFLTKRLINEIVKIGKEKKIPIVADPAKNRVYDFKGCDIIKPNQFEWHTFIESAGQSQQDWNSVLDCPLIVVTKSEQGMDYYENGVLKSLPGIKVAKVDITGAGDSAAAVLISGFLSGKSTEKLINLTNKIASKFVTLDRTEFPSSIVQAAFQQALKDQLNVFVERVDVQESDY